MFNIYNRYEPTKTTLNPSLIRLGIMLLLHDNLASFQASSRDSGAATQG